MSRLSQSLDVGAELERDRELRRKIAEARDGKSRDDEERIEIAPKFAQEINDLVDDVESPARKADDDDEQVIPFKKISENKAKEKKAPVKKDTKPVKAEQHAEKAKAEKAKAEKAKAEKAEKIKIERAKVEKADNDDLIIVRAEKKGKTAHGAIEKPSVGETERHVAGHGTPAVGPAPSAGPAAGPIDAPEDDGVGRLVLALLLVSIIAVVLIYAGLSQQGANALQQPAYAQYAQENNLTLVSTDNLEGAKLYWFNRALQSDNDAEAAAIMRMVLCNASLTEKSSPLNFTACPTSGMAFVVRENDIANLSTPAKCDSLEDVISCEGGYFVDGIIAFKDAKKPEAFLVKSGGQFTVVEGGKDSIPEALTVVSDKSDNYVAYTLPVASSETMAVKFFVGGAFNGFERAFLDHSVGSERAAVYVLA